MRLNPILIKELKIRARSMRIPIFVMLYVVLMAFFAVFMLISSVGINGSGGKPQYYSLNELFAALGMIQCLVAGLVSLVCGAGTFVNERERGTLDILLMTPVRPWELVNGKLFSSVITGCLFAFAAMPVLALGTIYGGTGVDELLFLVMVIGILSFTCSAVGMFCSVLCNRSGVAVICAAFAFLAISVIPDYLSHFLCIIVFGADYSLQGGLAVLIGAGVLVFNPIMLYYGFYDRVTGESLVMYELQYGYGISEGTFWYEFLEKYFITGCVIAQIVLVVLFALLTGFVLKKMRNVR